MTKQEYYDLLVQSAYDGTFPSVDDSREFCRYRGDMTASCPRRCAVGLLIPDDLYTPGIEGFSVLSACTDGLINIPAGMSMHDLAPIQEFHDREAGEGWNADRFVEKISELKVFADIRDKAHV